MEILHYFNYREFPDGNHRIREELSSYGSAGDEIKNREAPDKNGRVGMSVFPSDFIRPGRQGIP